MIEIALITLPSRAEERIFGRPLLERLIILCRRAGISKFIIEVNPGLEDRVVVALGNLSRDPAIQIVPSLRDLTRTGSFDKNADCIRFAGNLVLAQSQLPRVIEQYLAKPAFPLTILSADNERGGSIIVGPMGAVTSISPIPLGSPQVSGWAPASTIFPDSRTLPFALNGRPEDREEAELRLAQAVRYESSSTDALMARMVDRRLSWRLSRRLARTRITPNQVTIINTALGVGCAALLASTSYWCRLSGALLFLLSITLDGVDGEVARLRMLESRSGERLDVLTDNIVHVAVFIGIALGCHRVSNSSAYFYVLGTLLTGFAACAVSVNRALSVAGAEAHRWISQVERVTGRDFAYLLVILASLNRLYYFIWGAAVGTHVFALSLWRLTGRYRKKLAPAAVR